MDGSGRWEMGGGGTNLLLLMFGGGAARPEEVLPVEVLGLDGVEALGSLLLLLAGGSLQLLQVQPAQQFHAEHNTIPSRDRLYF